MSSRISALLGKSDGLTDPRQTRAAAFRLAVKYSDSVRSYMRRAASNAIAWRSLASAIGRCAAVCLASLSGAAARLVRDYSRELTTESQRTQREDQHRGRQRIEFNS